MDNYLGEIRMFAGNFAPKGWALCNGQLLPISQNTALFSLLGTSYGGDGRTNFALPKLQSNAPMHFGDGSGLTSRALGEQGGSSFVTLNGSGIPVHTHVPMGEGGGSDIKDTTNGTTWGSALRAGANRYAGDANLVIMSPLALGVTGSSQPHNNMQPYLALTFIVALEGIFPQRP